jgi:hypothetical protein
MRKRAPASMWNSSLVGTRAGAWRSWIDGISETALSEPMLAVARSRQVRI